MRINRTLGGLFSIDYQISSSTSAVYSIIVNLKLDDTTLYTLTTTKSELIDIDYDVEGKIETNCKFKAGSLSDTGLNDMIKKDADSFNQITTTNTVDVYKVSIISASNPTTLVSYINFVYDSSIINYMDSIVNSMGTDDTRFYNSKYIFIINKESTGVTIVPSGCCLDLDSFKSKLKPYILPYK